MPRARNADDFYNQSRLETGLIAATLCLLSLGILAFNPGETTINPKAFVYKDGCLVKKIDLGKDEAIILPDCRMELLVKNKAVKIRGSSCKNKVCMHMGWAGPRQKTLVCVPNKVVVEVKTEQPSSLDAVCY